MVQTTASPIPILTPKPLAKATQRGFTLIEATLGIMLLSILLMTGASMMTDSIFVTQSSNKAVTSAGTGRYALERLTREIRNVEYEIGSNRFNISTHTATHLSFVKVNSSGLVNVDIALSGQTLTLGYPSLTSNYTLADNVSAFSLTYSDQDGVATTDSTQIRYIGINMTLSEPNAPALTLQSLVALRGS